MNSLYDIKINLELWWRHVSRGLRERQQRPLPLLHVPAPATFPVTACVCCCLRLLLLVLATACAGKKPEVSFRKMFIFNHDIMGLRILPKKVCSLRSQVHSFVCITARARLQLDSRAKPVPSDADPWVKQWAEDVAVLFRVNGDSESVLILSLDNFDPKLSNADSCSEYPHR